MSSFSSPRLRIPLFWSYTGRRNLSSFTRFPMSSVGRDMNTQTLFIIYRQNPMRDPSRSTPTTLLHRLPGRKEVRKERGRAPLAPLHRPVKRPANRRASRNGELSLQLSLQLLIINATINHIRLSPLFSKTRGTSALVSPAAPRYHSLLREFLICYNTPTIPIPHDQTVSRTRKSQMNPFNQYTIVIRR